MLRSSLLSCTALALLTTPALADITPEQVWADWQAYLNGFGYQTSATETRDGDTLALSDIQMKMTMPDGTVSMSMPEVRLQDRGDGTVSVVMSENMPMDITMDPGDGETVTGQMIYRSEGMSLIASGDPNDTTYTFEADSLGMTMNMGPVDGVEVGPIDVAMTNLAGTSRTIVDGARSYDQAYGADSLSFNMTFPEIEGEGGGSMKGAYEGLKFAGVLNIPEDMKFDPENPASLFMAGFNFNGGFEFASGSGQFNVNSPDGSMEANATGGAGRVGAAMSAEGITYDVEQADVKVQAGGSAIPFPITLDMARSAFNLTMPMQKSDEPQPFALGFTMGDFTISETIWSLIDPTAQLPRDPATLDLDLAGTATVLSDMMSPQPMSPMGPPQVPAQFESLDIRNLTISAAGASINGQGAFTFDNDDMQTIPGMPRPEGKVTLDVAGANGLMDKLVAIGLLPEQQATMGRMMMSMFGTAGAEPDTLQSVIEVTPQGQVLANGQRIR